MSLISILQDVAVDTGLSLASAENKNLVILMVNNAARELYNKTDLIGAMREQVFIVDPNQQQISFPYYVGDFRGIRSYDTNRKLVANDMRPRFFHGAWLQPTWSWRIKDFSPIARDISNAGPLTFTLPQASLEMFNVIVVGSTTEADNTSEVIQFNVGDLTKTSTKQFNEFPGIKNISKDRVTSYNLTVTDVNGVTISEIPNHRQNSYYTVVQVTDQRINMVSQGATLSNYEILYKQRLDPFVNDYDEFPCQGYDDVIKWVVLSHFFSKKSDEISLGKALGYMQQAINLINERENSFTMGKEKEVQFAPNRFETSLRASKFGYNNVFPYPNS